MLISFANKKVAKAFNEGAQLEKIHGTNRARKIRIRLKELRAATSLKDFWPPGTPPERCHELTEGKEGNECLLSMDLDHPYRLIFKPDHDPIPRLDDGGLDWTQVTAIEIMPVRDTHE
jgi:plasmid maintenance system killer protein